jgi:hypothetical protein
MPFFENGHAVVVGIADYQNVSPLPRTVVDDATSTTATLIDSLTCAYRPAQVLQLLNGEATKDALRSALEEAAKKCDVESTFVFYVSSHGGQIEDGKHRGEYLLPVEARCQNDESLARTAISGRELSSWLGSIPARRLVAIFDCCHSGGIAQPKNPSFSQLKKGLSEQYYKQLAAGQGRVVFASCRESEQSYVRAGDINSVFTKHLLDGLRGFAPALGGVIRIFDLFHYLQPKVVSEQPIQHPVFKCEVEDNFPIAICTNGKSKIPIPTETPKHQFKYDVFISYRQLEPDKSWVRNVLLPRLKAEGLRVCIDFEFPLGTYLIAEMERAVENSRYTLAVLSPAYLKSNFAELESILAEHLGLELSQRRLLAIMRERCKPRLGMRARLWLDMEMESEFDANIARLAYELRMPPQK